MNVFSRLFRVARSYANSLGAQPTLSCIFVSPATQQFLAQKNYLIIFAANSACFYFERHFACFYLSSHNAMQSYNAWQGVDLCIACAVSSVEDPEKMLEQTVNEMQSDLIKMRQASAQVRLRLYYGPHFEHSEASL